MDPQRFPAAKRILLSTKEPPPGLASHLRKVKVDESRASAPRKISSLPENFTRQAGSTTVPNARSRHGLTQVSVPAHTPLPPLAGPSSIAPMAKPSLKRPRTSQPEATPVLAEVKPEDRPTATAVPPSTKRPRKHVRRALVPETIKWMVVKTLSSPPTSPPTRGGSRGGRGRGAGRGRGRGRGRGGAGMMSEPVLPHNTTQASPVALVDVSDESATQASDSQQFKPRQWSSSKEELFAILPGLGHNVNGIATEIFETPIVFLDGTNGISISNTCRIPNIGMDITIVRDFLRDPVVLNTQPPSPPPVFPDHPQSCSAFNSTALGTNPVFPNENGYPASGSNWDMHSVNDFPPVPSLRQSWEDPVFPNGYPTSGSSWNMHSVNDFPPVSSLRQSWEDPVFPNGYPTSRPNWDMHSVNDFPPVPSLRQSWEDPVFPNGYPTSGSSWNMHSVNDFPPVSSLRQSWEDPVSPNGYPTSGSSWNMHSVNDFPPVPSLPQSWENPVFPNGYPTSGPSWNMHPINNFRPVPSLPQSWEPNFNIYPNNFPSPPIKTANFGPLPSFTRLPIGMEDLIVFEDVPTVPSPTPPAAVQRTQTATAESMQINYQPIDIDPQNLPTSPPPITVPHPIPKELQVLVDAYIHNIPVLCIASNACMTEAWSAALPGEVEFAYLGFHTVVGVQEVRIPQLNEAPAPGDLSGRVKWEFKLQWSPGGEEELGLPSDTLEAEVAAPWWLPQSTRTENVVAEPSSPSNFPDDDLSAPEYKRQRLRSPNYAFKDTPIAHRCPSILPLHLLVPHNDDTELGFGPIEERRGWYCEECGKLNRVMQMRHRRCSSLLCRSKKSEWAVGGYSLPLESIRSPQDKMPVYLPTTTLPLAVSQPTHVVWPDGMSVLHYALGVRASTVGALGSEQSTKRAWGPAGEIFAKLIFTGNAPSLQLDATELLDSIQTGCELVREAIDSPYFSHTVAVDLDTPRPTCLGRAGEVIAKSVKKYLCAENQEMSIHRLFVKGWVDSGSRGTDFLSIGGSGNCAAIMCLGHGLTLKIYPKSYEHPSIGMNDLVLIKMEEDVADGVNVIPPDPQLPDPAEIVLVDGTKPRKPRKLKVEPISKDAQLPSLTELPTANPQPPVPAEIALVDGKKPRKPRKLKAEPLAAELPTADLQPVENAVVEGKKVRKRRKNAEPISEDPQLLSVAELPTADPQPLVVDGKKPRKRRKLNAEPISEDLQLLAVAEVPTANPQPSVAVENALDDGKKPREVKAEPISDDVQLPIEPPSISAPIKRGRVKPPPFTVSLVHGDTLFLSGDDFDYSVVRSGTSILLVASGQNDL